MTLVFSCFGKKTVWLAADRRLTFTGPKYRDDAHKVVALETVDGIALIGYAGLGTTGQGVEPSDWIVRVLRGRNAPLEVSLKFLARAAKEQLPLHLGPLGVGTHVFVASAFLKGVPVHYTVALVRKPDTPNYELQLVRQVATLPNGRHQAPRFHAAGSGSEALYRDRRWLRLLLCLVRRHEEGRLSNDTVAREFARVIEHIASVEPTVGAKSIVAWRGGVRGGGQFFFDGVAVDGKEAVFVPTVTRGVDLHAKLKVLTEHCLPQLERYRAKGQGAPTSEPISGLDELNAKLRGLPDSPDESL